LGKTIFGNLHAVWIIAIQQHHAVLRYDVEQTAEAQFDLREIVKDVGMIELDVVHDQQFGQVVNEFRALVEERAVVFVTLNDEIFRIDQPRALSKVFRNATDEITGFVPGFLHDPRQQRCRRSFSVRTGDDQIVSSAQKIVF